MAPGTPHEPPSIDPVAARRWADRASRGAPWLHEEIARRMADRLEVIRLPVRAWADWNPLAGGEEGAARVAARYPEAERYRVLAPAQLASAAPKKVATRWRWARRAPRAWDVAAPPDGAAQLVWANMLAHHVSAPLSLLGAWHRALSVNGFLMFSCLGPDTLKELRALYAACGWPPPSHQFTDMHDWGEQLVQAGFAEPVMDMERVTLTFPTPGRLLGELRGLGRNLHVQRFGALRGRAWLGALHRHLEGTRGPEGTLAVTFEVIYGHAIKPPPRHAVTGETSIDLGEFRQGLTRARTAR